MSNAGWYPDPGGQPGMYRYWTGTEWTSAITANPAGTQPPSGPGQPAGAPPGYQQDRRRGAAGWWIGGLAALAAVVVAIWFVAQSFGTGGGILGGADPTVPGGNATQLICPPGDDSTTLPTAGQPGWITGGRLAYPALGDPWATGIDDRVPFGSLATVQTVIDQPDFDGKGASWVASVLVSDLFVGDGFASTKQGAEIVLKCVIGTYYSNTVVTQDLVSSAQHDVDGHSGWLIETELSFNIPNLNATSERVLLLVVQTGTDEYGLFYASVPNTLEDLMPDAREALSGLRVQE